MPTCLNFDTVEQLPLQSPGRLDLKHLLQMTQSSNVSLFARVCGRGRSGLLRC